MRNFVQESAAKFTVFIFCKKKFFKNLVFLADTVADLAVRYTLWGRHTLCAHCIVEIIYYCVILILVKPGFPADFLSLQNMKRIPSHSPPL
jgi:hypothetical protein